jgi:PAS domain S-box-containing protein
MQFGRTSQGESEVPRPAPAPAPAPDFLSGGGDTGALLRGLDWTGSSPLGRPANWPQSLRSVVGLLLNSQFPMFVAWGPELGFLYNDAYAVILGDKHPDALGKPFREVWPEIWPDLVPLIDAALAGQASYREDLPLLLNRTGREEETWFTFSYSPVRDESGAVAGLFCACTETTNRVRLEAELRVSEGVLQHMGEAFALLDQDMRIELVNAEAVRLDGRPRDEIVGKTHAEAYPDAQLIGELHRRAMAGQKPVDYEHCYRFESGHEAWLEMRDYPLPGGKLAVFYRDVTERHVAAARLKESEERFRQMADSVPAFIWFAAPNGEVQYLNSRWYAYTGQTEAEALSNGWALTLHPEDVEATATAWTQARERELPYEVEARYRHHEGAYRWYVARAAPVRDQAGRVTAWFGTSSDIHDRKLAEAALQESEARLRALTDHLPGGMVYQITADPQGNRRFLHVSQSYEQMTGTPAEALLADASAAYANIHPDDLATLQAAEEQVLRDRGHFDVQARFRRASGEYGWCRIISAPRDQPDGSTIWDGIQIDITDQKSSEEAVIAREAQLRLALEAGQMAEVTFHISEGAVTHRPSVSPFLSVRSPSR